MVSLNTDVLLDRLYHILGEVLRKTVPYTINRLYICLAEMIKSLPDLVGTNGSMIHGQATPGISQDCMS